MHLCFGCEIEGCRTTVARPGFTVKFGMWRSWDAGSVAFPSFRALCFRAEGLTYPGLTNSFFPDSVLDPVKNPKPKHEENDLLCGTMLLFWSPDIETTKPTPCKPKL